VGGLGVQGFSSAVGMAVPALLVTMLSFLPALALGPLAEALH